MFSVLSPARRSLSGVGCGEQFFHLVWHLKEQIARQGKMVYCGFGLQDKK